MNTKQLNEQFYAKRELVGTVDHCLCEDCIFYAEQIMKNNTLVEFLHTKGLDPRKANEVWCYMEKDGYKHYTIDFLKCMQIKKKHILLATQKSHFMSTSTLKKSSFHMYAQ